MLHTVPFLSSQLPKAYGLWDFSSLIGLLQTTLWHGSNKLGYDISFDVCTLYDVNTYLIVGYQVNIQE